MMEEQEPKIEWIGPKILVIVRIPESRVVEGESSEEDLIATLSSNDDFKQFCFISIRQEGINQIEFEYPKNYCCHEPKPPVLTLKSVLDGDPQFKNFLKANKSNL